MKWTLALPLLLAACAQQADLDASPANASFQIGSPYQQAYASLNKGARTCMAGTSGSVVDGQLYPDLGYGEVSAGMQALSYLPVMEARVAKSGAGSALTVKSTGMAKAGIARWANYWANGGTRCPSLSMAESPPA